MRRLIDVHLVASAGSATADNLLASVMLVPDETYTFPEVVGHLIENGGTIYTVAGTASSIAIRASGIEIT
jgi:hypothetical protein